MIKLLAAIELLILVQGAAPALPAVDQLHEALNITAAKRGIALRMEFSGCMKDGGRFCRAPNVCSVICYYELAPKVPIEAKANAPQGPTKSIEAKLPGGKENAERMVRVAGALALTLIPNLSDADILKLMQKLAAKSNNVFDTGERNAELGSLVFRYEANSTETTLQIY